MKAALQHWYGTQSARDQRALRIGALVLLPLSLLGGAWAINDHFAARRALLAEDRALAERVSAEIASRLAAGETLSGPGTPLADRVTRALDRAGLQSQVVSVQAASAEATRVELALRDAPVEGLLSALGGLAQREGVVISSAKIVRASPGRVDASLVLQAP